MPSLPSRRTWADKHGVERRVVHQWFSARKKKAKKCRQEVASEAGDIGARKEDKEQKRQIQKD